jgi:hypothetical protein
MLVNTVLRRISGSERDEVTRGSRKLNNEEHQMLFSSNIIRIIKLRIRLTGHVARIKDMRNAYKMLVGKSEGKGAGVEGKVILKWILRTCPEGVDWIHMAQDRDRWRALVNTVMNLRVP